MEAKAGQPAHLIFSKKKKKKKKKKKNWVINWFRSLNMISFRSQTKNFQSFRLKDG